jgi:hypothetical protein
MLQLFADSGLCRVSGSGGSVPWREVTRCTSVVHVPSEERVDLCECGVVMSFQRQVQRQALTAVVATVAVIGTAVAQQLPSFKDERRLPQAGQTTPPPQGDPKPSNDEAARRQAEADAKKKAEDEARRLAEADAKKKAEDEARRLAEADAKKKAEDEARRLAEADAKKRAEDDARRLAEADAKKRAEDTARRTAQPPRTPAEVAESERLLARGRQFFASSDVNSARLLFERAADAGNAAAARELARTYDAAALARVGAVSVEANPQLAAQWNKRADELQPPPSPTPTPAAATTVSSGGAAPADQRQVQADAERQRAVAAAQQAAAQASVRPATPAATAPPALTPPIAPVPAPAPQIAAPATPPNSDAARYLTRGRAMLRNGDVAGGREFFQRAADDGSAEAALEMARTYDPVTLAQSAATVGVSGDVQQARRWYERAQGLGTTGLADILRRLAQR